MSPKLECYDWRHITTLPTGEQEVVKVRHVSTDPKSLANDVRKARQRELDHFQPGAVFSIEYEIYTPKEVK